MNLQELINRSRMLRESLITLVFDERNSELPDLEVLREAISTHGRLLKDIDELKLRATELTRQQSQLDALQTELRSKKEKRSQALQALERFHGILGAAAYEGFLRGTLNDQPLFVDRNVCGRKLVSLKTEHDELEKASGIFAKAKASARRAIIWGQITFEENRVQGLNTEIGRGLITTQKEESVACNETHAIIAEIALTRCSIADQATELELLAARVEARKAELNSRFGIEGIEYAKQLQREILPCRKAAEAKHQQLSSLRAELPERLLNETTDATLPNETPFWETIRQIREADSEITRSSIAS